MRSIQLVVALTTGAALLILAGGCGGNNIAAPACGNATTCQASDPVCSRPCGQGRTMLCQCGTGLLAGMLTCDDATCARPESTGGSNGGAGRNGRGGATGTAGRNGRGSGGANASGGAIGTGGRMGRGTGGATSTGGMTGTGGFTPSDAGTAICPASVEAGGVACTPSATPVCKTDCVGGMYNICTCIGGNFICPSTQIACP